MIAIKKERRFLYRFLVGYVVELRREAVLFNQHRVLQHNARRFSDITHKSLQLISPLHSTNSRPLLDKCFMPFSLFPLSLLLPCDWLWKAVYDPPPCFNPYPPPTRPSTSLISLAFSRRFLMLP